MISPPLQQAAIVVGGGPAGLRAAEILAGAGHSVELFEGKPSVGRKFLVAGRGGLNLTHSEALASFTGRYRDGDDPDVGGGERSRARWTSLLDGFGPGALREWAAGLGVETYVGSSGRVFPRGQQAAVPLRRWVTRLRDLGVTFHVNHRWENLGAAAATGGHGERQRWQLGFRVRMPAAEEPQIVTTTADAVVFALGGASWPQTGSDGGWTTGFEQQLGLSVAPWQPANCGWEVAWSPALLAAAEGKPLKNITLTAGAHTAVGEALVTRYGLEGGTLYALGPALRALGPVPQLSVDFKPGTDPARLAARLPAPGPDGRLGLDAVAGPWRLGEAARAMLEFHGPGRSATPRAWLAAVRGLSLPLRGPRSIPEAISCAGGLSWADLHERTLELRRWPGVFAAGEMLDWEAPTGGYLLQGCFATGTRAGHGAVEFLAGAA